MSERTDPSRGTMKSQGGGSSPDQGPWPHSPFIHYLMEPSKDTAMPAMMIYFLGLWFCHQEAGSLVEKQQSRYRLFGAIFCSQGL